MELRIKEIIYSTNPVVKAEFVFEEGEQDVEIIFDDLQIECVDRIEHDSTWIAEGYDSDGNKYRACALFSCGELIGIEDIEQTENAFEKECRREYDQKKANGDFESLDKDSEFYGITDQEKGLKIKYGWMHGVNPLNY